VLHSWIYKGLVGAGLIAKFCVAYWTLTSLAIAGQVAMIVLVFILNHCHFAGRAQVGLSLPNNPQHVSGLASAGRMKLLMKAVTRAMLWGIG